MDLYLNVLIYNRPLLKKWQRMDVAILYGGCEKFNIANMIEKFYTCYCVFRKCMGNLLELEIYITRIVYTLVYCATNKNH